MKIHGVVFLVTLVGPSVLWAAVKRPALLVVAIVGLAFINTRLPILADLGGALLRPTDLLFAGLVFSVLAHASLSHVTTVRRRAAELLVPLLIFLMCVGASLTVVGYRTPQLLSASTISFLRLVETALLAPLTYAALRRERDIRLLGKAVMLYTVLSVGLAGLQMWPLLQGGGLARVVAGRFGGLLGENTLGLVSGLSLLYLFVEKRRPKHLTAWLLLVATGLAGLSLAKSASSIVATMGTLAVLLLGRRFRRPTSSGVWPVALAMVPIGLALLAIAGLRASDAQALVSLTGGSFAHRLMLAYGGFLIFLQQPALGIGWQASGTEYYIGSPVLNAILMEAFPNLPLHYFPVISTTSVHNMYIQLLAETGLLGMAAFACGVAAIVRNARRIIRDTPARAPYSALVEFYGLGLIFLLIWWNTNPLYGGQVESTLAFAFLGALAAIDRMNSMRYKSRALGSAAGPETSVMAS